MRPASSRGGGVILLDEHDFIAGTASWDGDIEDLTGVRR